jgi:DNA-binding transcriptional MerR regulator
MTKVYTDTSGKLARDAETTVPTVNLYARLNLLDYVVASNGVKLFRGGQAARVREIKRQRLEARGQRKTA